MRSRICWRRSTVARDGNPKNPSLWVSKDTVWPEIATTREWEEWWAGEKGRRLPARVSPEALRRYGLEALPPAN